MTAIPGILIIVLHDGGCDLKAPHEEAVVGKGLDAKRAIGRIRNAGGRELHLCQPCRRAILAEERAAYRFVAAT